MGWLWGMAVIGPCRFTQRTPINLSRSAITELQCEDFSVSVLLQRSRLSEIEMDEAWIKGNSLVLKSDDVELRITEIDTIYELDYKDSRTWCIQIEDE